MIRMTSQVEKANYSKNNLKNNENILQNSLFLLTLPQMPPTLSLLL